MNTREEILARMSAIMDASAGRALNAAEQTEYAGLEADLKAVNESDAARARHAAYMAPAAMTHVAEPKKDDTVAKAFNSYLRGYGPNADIAHLRVSAPSNAQSAGSDPAGGYMIPQEFRQKLVEVRKSFGGLAAEVDSFSTGNGSFVEYPSLDDTANSGQITAEGSAVSGGADLTFGTITLGAFRYTSSGAGNAPLKVSVELLQDAAFDVEGLVARKLGERIARKQAVDWVNGAGTTLPFGIARAALTPDTTLVAGNVLTYAQLLAIETALDPAYEDSAKWVMNKTSWQAVKGVVDSTGRPLVTQTSDASMGGRPQKVLLGYPVVIDQAFGNNSTLSTMWAVLGDLREAYVIRRVQDTVIVVNPYSSAASGQVEFTAWERADANVQNRKAYVLSKSNAA